MEQIEVYTLKKLGYHWWLGYRYQILFEDTPIREFIGVPYQQVKDWTNLLNTAWNLGLNSGMIMKEFELKAAYSKQIKH